MAPEQRRGEVSPATDVYASAVVLYEMFTGRTPWPREAVMGGVRRADDFRLPADVIAGLTDAAPALAEEIEHHIMRLGDPDPTKRPTTAQALAESQRLRERIIAAGAA
jgi:serine/threonine-protein kinase